MWGAGFAVPRFGIPDRSQHLPETIFPKQRSNLGNELGLALVVRPTMGFGHVGVHRKSVSRVLPGPFAGNAKVRIIALNHGKVNMKKPIKRPIEQACPACDGTGIAPVKLSARSGVRIYPPRCKECDGKGKAPPTPSKTIRSSRIRWRRSAAPNQPAKQARISGPPGVFWEAVCVT